MATYKVIQDIEADDKLLGPLSLKQFIYFAITCICLYLTFFTATKGAPFMAVFLLPPGLFFGVLGFPWSKTQPTEVWLLAKVRFWFKPRKRIWNQAGIKELVTITVPKKVERVLTDGLDQTQVRSRLTALAKTVDSRGWAVKQLGASPFGGISEPSPDRLTTGTQVSSQVVVSDVADHEDVLDTQNNQTAQNIDKLINKSTRDHKTQLQEELAHHKTTPQPQATNSAQKDDFWFMSQNDPKNVPSGMATGQGQTVTAAAPATTTPAISKDEEAALLDKLHKSEARKSSYNTHQKTLLPLDEQEKLAKQQAAAAQQKQESQQQAQTAQQKPAPAPKITQLAQNNDLNIETISRQANKEDDHPDEVVISLH
jgi:hypothetical protein